MASETVENYLKGVYTLARESPTGEAGVVRLAGLLGVTKGSATSMVKKLATSGFVKAERYGGVTLTAKGTRAALDVLRRHRLIETFLVQTLKLDWSEVHEEAERLEHALSPRLLDRIDAFLGRPATDPHGDPIPDATGAIRHGAGTTLASFPEGAHVRVLRVVDQGRAFLTFASKHGLVPGALVRVVRVDVQADAIHVQATTKKPVPLSRAAAIKVECETVRG